jgi:hypothetical protein
MQATEKQNDGSITQRVGNTMSTDERSTGTPDDFSTWSTKEDEVVKGPSMIGLLIKTRIYVLNKEDAVSAMVASMFEISLAKSSETKIMEKYLAYHLLFGAALAGAPSHLTSTPRFIRDTFAKYSP